jgi:homoserine dehydrogenase
MDRLEILDEPLRAKLEQAHASNGSLRFIARLEDGCAKVGLEILAPDDPLAAGSGTDNRVAIWSDRYRDQPMVIQGPGAGATVTAAALLDDALRLSARTPGT